MPKIIDDPESRLIRQAGQQIEASGYGAMTVRSVAKACGLGVGTVYNYFPSKEAMAAAWLLERWELHLTAIEAVSTYSQDPRPVCQCIYDQLVAFAQRHQSVFRDEAAAAVFVGSFSRYHGMLRDQLAQPLKKFCREDFTPAFLAEALLTWSMAGRSFEELYGLLEKHF